MDPSTVPSSAFYYEELSRALSECGFGILAWDVNPATPELERKPAQATASVTLLAYEEERGPEISVELTAKGYLVSH